MEPQNLGPHSTLLTQAGQIVFSTVPSSDPHYRTVTSMFICNTSDIDQKIYLSIYDVDGNKLQGALYWGYILEYNRTLTIPERRIKSGQAIYAAAETEGVVSFSFDVTL